MLWNTFLLALREIRRNLLRSFLTILGIVIGVSAVITMVTLGNGATQSVSQQISSLGTNLLMLRYGQRMGMGVKSDAPAFKKADLEAIRNQISGLAAVAPSVTSPVTAVASAKNWNTKVTGTSNEYFTAGNWTIADGRPFSEVEMRGGKAVCIIGDSIKSELYGNQNPVGSKLRVKDFSCQIIGLLQPKGQTTMGTDQDDVIIMPLRTVQRRVSGNQDIGMIMLSAQNGVSTDLVKSQLEKLMRERRKINKGEDDDFSVLDTKQIAQTLSGTLRVMTALLGSVAAVSLLVGGIGIMNIMLVSVTERTREIGIRLAIGALERDVLLQFLIEAMVLSSFGGLVGILLATVASITLSGIMQLPYLFNFQINLLSFFFSAAIGVIFGYFPARRAAKLNPIDALRHE